MKLIWKYFKKQQLEFYKACTLGKQRKFVLLISLTLIPFIAYFYYVMIYHWFHWLGYNPFINFWNEQTTIHNANSDFWQTFKNDFLSLLTVMGGALVLIFWAICVTILRISLDYFFREEKIQKLAENVQQLYSQQEAKIVKEMIGLSKKTNGFKSKLL